MDVGAQRLRGETVDDRVSSQRAPPGLHGRVDPASERKAPGSFLIGRGRDQGVPAGSDGLPTDPLGGGGLTEAVLEPTGDDGVKRGQRIGQIYRRGPRRACHPERDQSPPLALLPIWDYIYPDGQPEIHGSYPDVLKVARPSVVLRPCGEKLLTVADMERAVEKGLPFAALKYVVRNSGAAEKDPVQQTSCLVHASSAGGRGPTSTGRERAAGANRPACTLAEQVWSRRRWRSCFSPPRILNSTTRLRSILRLPTSDPPGRDR